VAALHHERQRLGRGAWWLVLALSDTLAVRGERLLVRSAQRRTAYNADMVLMLITGQDCALPVVGFALLVFAHLFGGRVVH
jgi:hypothetical protein